MPISGKKRREMKNRAEDGLIARIREELPDLEEREHRPHILYRGGAFIVLYNGGLSPLTLRRHSAAVCVGVLSGGTRECVSAADRVRAEIYRMADADVNLDNQAPNEELFNIDLDSMISALVRTHTATPAAEQDDGNGTGNLTPKIFDMSPNNLRDLLYFTSTRDNLNGGRVQRERRAPKPYLDEDYPPSSRQRPTRPPKALPPLPKGRSPAKGSIAKRVPVRVLHKDGLASIVPSLYNCLGNAADMPQAYTENRFRPIEELFDGKGATQLPAPPPLPPISALFA